MSVKRRLSLSTLAQAAAELAGVTGAAALKHYRRDLTVERKPDGSPVTNADREAEKLARGWITRRFPGDAIVGEEFGVAEGTSGRTWLLDPIDGTRTYVRGIPFWGSLVAVVEGDQVLAGAAAYPAVQEELAAAPGEGCWHDGVRCQVSEVARLAEALVLTTDAQAFVGAGPSRGWDHLARAAGTVRTWGDCYGYLLVATGRAEVMADARLNPWDCACFVPILAEAGGRFSDLAGVTTWNAGSGIATNAALATEARRWF